MVSSISGAAKTGTTSPSQSGWHAAILRVAAHYGLGTSPQQLRLDADWAGDRLRLLDLARRAGLLVQQVSADTAAITTLRLPMVAEFRDGSVGVIEALRSDGFQIAFAGDEGLPQWIDRAEMGRALLRLYVMRPASGQSDGRVDDYIAPYRPDWLRRILLADLRPYGSIMLASLVTNVLALAGIIFSMQVYDRVVPAQSMPTLYVLFGGVMLATVFGYVMRVARIRVTEATGKAADLRISDKVFGHALRVKGSARPRATGTFISQIRELEQIRDMMTSTTVAAVADVPFFLLFCALFFYIAPTLVWIPIAATVLLILPGILAQRRLRRLTEANMRESALRSAMLVEAVQGLDDIKSMQAEARFQNQWNHYNEVTAGSGLRLRSLTNALATWSQTMQNAVFAFVVFFGAPLVMAGDMSTGVLVAASMLSSRMIAPLTSVTQIINRWQQAKVARQGIDKLLELPVDSPETERRIHRPSLSGAFRLQNAVFGHDRDRPVLKVSALSIAPGERVAILGRNGTGKSTLLTALSGLLEPLSGQVRLDDVTLGLIDPADVRRDIGHLSQQARLFHGTLRENLKLGAPRAQDEEILAVLSDLQLADFVQRLPEGLDHMMQEGGFGLSGGQRQGLLLARLLLRRPRMLLLDEPTAALDDATEAAVIHTLSQLSPDVGVIVATHRPAMLRIVDRIIVLNGGGIAMDGPKDKVLADLRRGKEAA